MTFSLSNVSKSLINYFPNNNDYKKKYNISQIYDDLTEGFNFIQENKNNISIKTFSAKNPFVNPQAFSYIPPNIQENIQNHLNLNNCLSYDFILFDRKIQIFFILQTSITSKIIKKYNKFTELLLCWLFIISKYSSHNCIQPLNIYIYHSHELKNLPDNNRIILNQEHVNTAFTQLCNEIIIFRKEEWFKVFIHESIHNFNLDFSNINNTSCNKKIKQMFHVKSKINLYESYAEFWARIMNICFISYSISNNYSNFAKVFQKIINIEVSYSTFQMIKILNYMNLTYSDITDNHFQENYSENTNVLAYFVITNILMFNYNDVLLWCNNNNNNLYDFKKTNKNLLQFCNFIERKYKDPTLLEHVDKFEKIFIYLLQSSRQSKKIKYLIKNLRMTLCEIE
jgi:hypothetical protein